MARVGRQTDPGSQAQPPASVRLRLLICIRCWHRPWDCSCEKRGDGQRVKSEGWRQLPVFTAAQVRDAVETVTGEREDASEVLDLLSAQPRPGRRPSRAVEHNGSRREGGRQIA